MKTLIKTVVALAGEGIGLEVVEATCEVLNGADVPVKILTPLQISAPGSPVPEETQRACRAADAVLFGAAGPATTRVVGWLKCRSLRLTAQKFWATRGRWMSCWRWQTWW